MITSWGDLLGISLQSPPNPRPQAAAPQSLLARREPAGLALEDQPSKKGSRVTRVLKNFLKSLSLEPPSSTPNASKVQERWLLSGEQENKQNHLNKTVIFDFCLNRQFYFPVSERMLQLFVGVKACTYFKSHSSSGFSSPCHFSFSMIVILLPFANAIHALKINITTECKKSPSEVQVSAE